MRTGSTSLAPSEAFTNADKLLEECAKRGLEGIVCKEKGGAYWSGTKCGWVKVKTAPWRAAMPIAARCSRSRRSNRQLGRIDRKSRCGFIERHDLPVKGVWRPVFFAQ